MHLFRISSTLSRGALEHLLNDCQGLVLDSQHITSHTPLNLAYALAQKSFKEKTNLAVQMRFEFLLWLAGTRDIKNALKKLGANNSKDMLLITFHKPPLKKLKAKKLPLKLNKEASWQELEKISLSRI